MGAAARTPFSRRASWYFLAALHEMIHTTEMCLCVHTNNVLGVQVRRAAAVLFPGPIEPGDKSGPRGETPQPLAEFLGRTSRLCRRAKLLRSSTRSSAERVRGVNISHSGRTYLCEFCSVSSSRRFACCVRWVCGNRYRPPGGVNHLFTTYLIPGTARHDSSILWFQARTNDSRRARTCRLVCIGRAFCASSFTARAS